MNALMHDDIAVSYETKMLESMADGRDGQRTNPRQAKSLCNGLFGAGGPSDRRQERGWASG
jgi:hypothetical protein